MKTKFLAYGAWSLLSILVISCQIEPVDPDDYRPENEIKDNEIVLSANTIAMDEADINDILGIGNDRIVVSKNAKILQKLSPGKIIFKNNMVGSDSFALYRKVVEVRERPNNYLILTEQASLSETFYKYTLDTRSDNFTLRPRTAFDEYVTFNTPFGDVNGGINFEPQCSANFTFDDFIFTSSFDSSEIVNGIVDPPSFDMQLKNFRAEFTAEFLLEAMANISLDTPIVEHKVLFRMPEFGLALYMDFTLGVSGSLEGLVQSPEERFNFGGYDLSLHYNYNEGNPTYSLGPSQITPGQASNQEWVIRTDGNVEIRLGASFYISVFGAPDLAKLGFNIAGYLNPGIHHTGDLNNPRPGYNLNFEAGLVGNVFVEFAFFFNSTLEFAGPDIKIPLISGYTVIPFCSAYDNVIFQFDAGSGDFLLRVDNSDPSRTFYNVKINGSTISVLGNSTFDYNKDYVVQVPASNEPVNEIVISDFFQSGCYIKDNFVNPNGFGSCNEVVFDAEGNDYCTFIVGETMWMSENLRISTAGVPVRNEGSPEERLYGRLYTFDEISSGALCPSGWHIPSKDEWEDLIYSLGGSEVAGLNMKYPSAAVWEGNIPVTGSFNAVPSGEYYSWQDQYGFLNKKAFFWSSEVGAFGEVYFYSVSSYLDDILEDFGSGKYDHSIKDIGYSCRCVREL